MTFKEISCVIWRVVVQLVSLITLIALSTGNTDKMLSVLQACIQNKKCISRKYSGRCVTSYVHSQHTISSKCICSMNNNIMK